jgi:hypothetical protein
MPALGRLYLRSLFRFFSRDVLSSRSLSSLLSGFGEYSLRFKTAFKGNSPSMQGPTAAQARQDSNTFEAAQRAWADKSVSARGKVGARGDNKGFAWLG